jgi:hypothetical protein
MKEGKMQKLIQKWCLYIEFITILCEVVNKEIGFWFLHMEIKCPKNILEWIKNVPFKKDCKIYS